MIFNMGYGMMNYGYYGLTSFAAHRPSGSGISVDCQALERSFQESKEVKGK